MGVFCIETNTGQIATRQQLIERGLCDPSDSPPKPWLTIQGPNDASTLWYAVLRKQVKGIFIGTLCIRHSDHYASLLNSGWEEVSVSEIQGFTP